MNNIFKIATKDKEVCLLYTNDDDILLLFTEKGKLTFGKVQLIETPTKQIISFRMNNLLERRITVKDEVIQKLKEWIEKNMEKQKLLKRKSKIVDEDNSGRDIKQIEK